jgi:hypothetical protein
LDRGRRVYWGVIEDRVMVDLNARVSRGMLAESN